MFFWLLLIVAFLFWITRERHPQIPGFYGHWLFGVLPELQKLSKQRQSHLFFRKFIGKRIGKFRLLFGQQAYVIAHPDVARQVWRDTEHFTRDPRFQNAVIDLMPFALFVIPGGDVWKKHRRLLQPGFGPVHLEHAQTAAETLSDQLVAYLKTLADKSEPIDIHAAMNALALDILGQVAFNADFKSRYSLPSFAWPFVGAARDGPEAKKVVQFFDSIVSPLIEQRRRQIQDGIIDQKDHKMDFLQRLLLADDKMTPEEIRGEIIGQLPTLKHPEIQERLYQDLLLHYKDRPLTIESLSECKYLDNVIKEGQRLHSTVIGSPRETIKPARFRILMMAFHSDPALWEEPEKFNPDRFEKPIVPGSFMPFGDGQMNCIGQKMAMIEMKVVLIRLLLAFKLELVPKQQLVYRSTVTLGLKDGLLIQCANRH
ncbi:cytochrome P450 [Gorgonomyces haynaldii]|nr:cytochrome P450 [Gorgonomyces haynaldii]